MARKAATKSATTKAAQSARPKTQTARKLASCGCSRERLVAIILAASVVAGVAIACGILGVPVTPTGTIPVRIDDSPGPLPPGPGPGPDPFGGLADAVAAEARNVDSRHRANECTAMADAIDRYLDQQSAGNLESLFSGLRRATSPAIPPRSAEAWRPFNLRVDELLAAEFESGRLTTVTDGVAALRAVANGLRDAAGRF